MKTLHEFAQDIAHGPSPLRLIDEDLGFTYRSGFPSYYVVPPIRQIGETSTAVTLVTAAAAVGKSSACNWIASQTDSPVLDLATSRVGNNSLTGTLTNAFGFSLAAKFFSDVHSGKRTLLIDALDEAEVRAGSENFSAFLGDLTRFARDCQGEVPSLVLFSRGSSAEMVEEYFIEEGVGLARYELEFFGKHQASELLDNRLDEDPFAKSLHRTHREVYLEARDELYGLVSDLLGHNREDEDWHATGLASFLGYAPVVETLARYLAVPNFQVLLNELRDPSSALNAASTQWMLLRELIENLLRREQEKFLTAQKEVLQSSSLDVVHPETLFTPEEQCKRTLAQAHLDVHGLSLPESLPSDIRSKYDKAARDQIFNHPFLDSNFDFINVVFRDYAFAKSLSDADAATHQSVRKKLADPEYRTSPALANFVASFTHADSLPSVSGKDLGFIIESLGSQLASDVLAMSFVWGDEESGRLVFVSSDSGLHVEFDIADCQEGIAFDRSLSSAHVFFKGFVKLGTAGRQFILGPRVVIGAEQLLLETEVVNVLADNAGPVILAASLFVDSGATEVSYAGPAGGFGVYWPELVWPWQEYAIPAADAPEAVPSRTTDRFFEFRRLVLRFANARSGSISVYKDLLDNRYLNGNALGRAILVALVAEGIMSDDTDFYRIDLRAFAARFGLGYQELRLGEQNAAVMEFLNGIDAPE